MNLGSSKPTPVRVYALVVCFASLAVFAVSLGISIYHLVGVMSPTTTVSSWRYNVYESDDEYLRSWRRSHEDEPILSPEELAAMRADEHARVLWREQAERRQGLLQQGISMVISASLFVVHWRLGRRGNARETAA